MEKNYTVVVTEHQNDDEGKGRDIERYRQTIDNLEVGRLAAFLNQKPRKRRKEKTA